MSEAQQAEATREPIAVEFKGAVYTVDPNRITVQALEDYDDGKYIAAMREILGIEEWTKYKTANPLALDLEAFFKAMMSKLDAAGEEGNSSASAGS